MNFDITYQFMLPTLEYFAKLTHSYGWAIILLTLLVRALVWPLVQSSTKNMQKMSQLQPQMKALQDRYKDDPELFQRKTMEFYQKNKMNPMGGCLPMLVQLPILFALFATFTGPPFGEKPVDMKVTVLSKEQAAKTPPHQDELSKSTSPFVSSEGTMAKLAMFPGEGTVVQGQKVMFGTRAIQGSLPDKFEVAWKVVPPGRDPRSIQPVSGENFTVTFDDPGDVHVQAEVPAIAKDESFLFIRSLGKVAKGFELLRPENWDSVLLIALFGLTMYLSQKYTVTQPKVPVEEMNEQQLIQQQTMKTMPIAMTLMFFFIPLPTGVFLYMVVSNLVQTLQTLLIMRQPVPAIVSVLDDSPVTMSSSTRSREDFQSGMESEKGGRGVAEDEKRKTKKKKKK